VGVLETWAVGYCRSRGYGEPTPGPAGLWMPVDTPTQRGRHVMASAEPEACRALIAAIAEPYVYVETLAPRAAVLPLLPAGWTARDPAWLMSRPLAAGAIAPPDGYETRLADEGPALRVEVVAPDGTIAARGRCGLVGEAAVFDQISTDPAHRRRGLGGLVMDRLTAAAWARGATEGVLIATADGRALYLSLGWTELAEVVSVISA
jgi:GNAT superfamily N-acetyltransferase